MIGSVRVTGNQAVTQSAADRLRSGCAGQPYFPSQLADRSRHDAAALRQPRIPSAAVDSSPGLSPDGTRADIVFTVQEGPQVFVDHVLIVGNDRTRAETISRELQFKTGDPLGLAAVAESQRRLATLGLFRRTRITELGHGVETTRDVVVTVEEAAATTIGYGGGLEAGSRIRDGDRRRRRDRATGGRAPRLFRNRPAQSVRQEPLGEPVHPHQPAPERLAVFRRSAAGARADASGYGFSEYRVLGTYREPRVMGTAADAFLTGTIEQQIRSSFNFARRALSAELVRRLTRQVSVNGNYQIQRTELFDEQIKPSDKLLIDRLYPQIRLSSFSLSAVRDGRDDPLEPSAGDYLSANGQIAARAIGSEVGFFKSYLTAQSFHSVPQARRMVLATSARVGLAFGFSG